MQETTRLHPPRVYTSINIPDSRVPTGADIDRSPFALRRYVRDVETKNDLAETIRENFRLHQEMRHCGKNALGSRRRPEFLRSAAPLVPADVN